MKTTFSPQTGRREPLKTSMQSKSAPNEKSNGMRTSTTLSVIVPVYNEQYLIQASLQRLRVLNESPLLDAISVIVVDDGSSDGSAAEIESFRGAVENDRSIPKIRWTWLRHEKNKGKGAAIQTARSRSVCAQTASSSGGIPMKLPITRETTGWATSLSRLSR